MCAIPLCMMSTMVYKCNMQFFVWFNYCLRNASISVRSVQNGSLCCWYSVSNVTFKATHHPHICWHIINRWIAGDWWTTSVAPCVWFIHKRVRPVVPVYHVDFNTNTYHCKWSTLTAVAQLLVIRYEYELTCLEHSRQEVRIGMYSSGSAHIDSAIRRG